MASHFYGSVRASTRLGLYLVVVLLLFTTSEAASDPASKNSEAGLTQGAKTAPVMELQPMVHKPANPDEDDEKQGEAEVQTANIGDDQVIPFSSAAEFSLYVLLKEREEQQREINELVAEADDIRKQHEGAEFDKHMEQLFDEAEANRKQHKAEFEKQPITEAENRKQIATKPVWFARYAEILKRLGELPQAQTQPRKKQTQTHQKQMIQETDDRTNAMLGLVEMPRIIETINSFLPEEDKSKFNAPPPNSAVNDAAGSTQHERDAAQATTPKQDHVIDIHSETASHGTTDGNLEGGSSFGCRFYAKVFISTAIVAAAGLGLRHFVMTSRSTSAPAPQPGLWDHLDHYVPGVESGPIVPVPEPTPPPSRDPTQPPSEAPSHEPSQGPTEAPTRYTSRECRTVNVCLNGPGDNIQTNRTIGHYARLSGEHLDTAHDMTGNCTTADHELRNFQLGLRGALIPGADTDPRCGALQRDYDKTFRKFGSNQTNITIHIQTPPSLTGPYDQNRGWTPTAEQWRQVKEDTITEVTAALNLIGKNLIVVNDPTEAANLRIRWINDPYLRIAGQAGECLILLNEPSFAWRSPAEQTCIAVHELGHELGLSHSNINQIPMSGGRDPHGHVCYNRTKARSRPKLSADPRLQAAYLQETVCGNELEAYERRMNSTQHIPWSHMFFRRMLQTFNINDRTETINDYQNPSTLQMIALNLLFQNPEARRQELVDIAKENSIVKEAQKRYKAERKAARLQREKAERKRSKYSSAPIRLFPRHNNRMKNYTNRGSRQPYGFRGNHRDMKGSKKGGKQGGKNKAKNGGSKKGGKQGGKNKGKRRLVQSNIPGVSPVMIDLMHEINELRVANGELPLEF